ncbi:hypothetical protein Celaphus_00004298 [Cervus elaphus hippelaphus]|uniref:Uncharacterized protein n=1 Tax=Cervus elaphus hippelaphus TaxID=46360 RepID=A0A212DBT9_CEREH|nr:hypothetical protein Celaphus_00004298 [Cervus elaphus hippelaphus]
MLRQEELLITTLKPRHLNAKDTVSRYAFATLKMLCPALVRKQYFEGEGTLFESHSRGALPTPQPDHRSQQPLAEAACVTGAWSSLGCCSSFCPRAQETSRILLASQDLGELGRPRGQGGRPVISTGASYLFKGLFFTSNPVCGKALGFSCSQKPFLVHMGTEPKHAA